jgi:tRNA(Ile)-lysidine synthase
MSVPEPLAGALRDAPPGALCVGYSGGVDSTVLLHALKTGGFDVRALHVDHGLQPESSAWAEHCRAFCAELRVPITVLRVQVDQIAALGPEGAARAARHAAFAAELRDGETLALAHHRDDQAETVLLRLLHGAGTEGLAGMRRLRPFARGRLWRPWLGVAREDLVAYARRHGLAWVEDPSNASPQHAARNHLRLAVMPTLQARWPDAARRIAAAAARVAEEADVLDALARDTLDALRDAEAGTLDLPRLRAQAPALRRALIGRWLDAHRLPRPPPGAWNELDALLDAREDAAPLWRWSGAEVRRYRDALYAMRPLREAASAWSMEWTGHAPLELPEGFGRLELDPPCPLNPPLRVQPRRGGERLAQAGVRRELRTLLQDLGLPPWQRERLPLLLDADGTVLAAADLAQAPAFAARLAALGTRLRWRRAAD